MTERIIYTLIFFGVAVPFLLVVPRAIAVRLDGSLPVENDRDGNIVDDYLL